MSLCLVVVVVMIGKVLAVAVSYEMNTVFLI